MGLLSQGLEDDLDRAMVRIRVMRTAAKRLLDNSECWEDTDGRYRYRHCTCPYCELWSAYFETAR